MGTLLSISNLQASFFPRDGELRAIDGVTFDIEDGATMGLVGESGCGKSTLARLLMHLIPRDSGELIFDGEGVGEGHGITLREFGRKFLDRRELAGVRNVHADRNRWANHVATAHFVEHVPYYRLEQQLARAQGQP